MEVMYVTDINNKYFYKRKFTSFMGEIRDLEILLTDIKNIEYKSKQKVKSLIDSKYLSSLNLDATILNKRLFELSNSELKYILLIKIISLKPVLIILNNFDLGFNYQERNNLINFLRKINAEEKINFIIISNNLIFMNKISDHLIIMKNKIIKYQGDMVSAIKQNIISKPEIIQFIDLANNKDAKLDYTLDTKDLLKNIYRSVF